MNKKNILKMYKETLKDYEESKLERFKGQLDILTYILRGYGMDLYSPE